MAEVIKSPPLVSDTHVISQADAESMIKSEEVDAEQSGPPTPVELDPSFVTNDQSTNEQTTHQAELQVQQRQELSAKLEQLTNENAGLEQTVEQLQEQLQNQQQAIENSNEATLQSGYQDGYQAGEQAASEEWSELIQTFLTLLESVNHAYQDLIEHEEDAVIDIVLTAVQKILGKQLITEKGILA
ncbi:MAG: hypothetical protein OEZ58_07935, partial [Gammaproteobacteria bacterium]|nr:hypothetical protein [Gammaproteobacteria bacterium]